MAGGSADCRGSPRRADALWEAGLDRTELMDLALELGSDVPFSVLGGTALGLGRGEQLSPLMTRGQFHWVFATAVAGTVDPGRLRDAGPAGNHDRGRRPAGAGGGGGRAHRR